MNKYILFFLIPIHIKITGANINDAQSVSLKLFNDSKCNNIIDYENIIVPVRCNCFTIKNNCIKKINQNIKFYPEIEYLKKPFDKKLKCEKFNNSYFDFNYNLSNQYCPRYILIFSIIFIFIFIILGIVFYIDIDYKKKKKRYQRIQNIKLDDINL